MTKPKTKRARPLGGLSSGPVDLLGDPTPKAAPERDPLAQMSPSTQQRQAARLIASAVVGSKPGVLISVALYESARAASFIRATMDPWVWLCLLGEGTDEDCAALQRALEDR